MLASNLVAQKTYSHRSPNSAAHLIRPEADFKKSVSVHLIRPLTHFGHPPWAGQNRSPTSAKLVHFPNQTTTMIVRGYDPASVVDMEGVLILTTTWRRKILVISPIYDHDATENIINCCIFF